MTVMVLVRMGLGWIFSDEEILALDDPLPGRKPKPDKIVFQTIKIN